jgi:uncharacterized membrane protein
MSARRKAPKPSTAVVAKEPQQGTVKHDALTEIAELLPGTAPVQDRVRQVIQQSKFQGPIPHPDIFRKYGEVVPDAPERILRVFEQDSAHAREIQNAALDAQKGDNKRVHWMAWSLIAGGYLLSALFAHWNKDWLAGIILTTTLAGTIAGFFQTKKSEKTDDKD